MLIFGLDPEPTLARAIARHLGQSLAPHEARHFEDGESKLRPLVDPVGADIYVVQGLHGESGDSPQDKLVKLLMFVATLRDHGASQVTAVVPYLAYSRKDRRTKPFDPLGSRHVAQLFEAVGTGAVITLEVHNVAAFENAFRRPVLNLDAHPAFDALVQEHCRGDRLVVASPDPGGVKRAQLWREGLQERWRRPVGVAFCDKRRTDDKVDGTGRVAGDVAGATVLLVDDLAVSGHTLQRGAAALRAAGADRVLACIAHPLFAAEAAQTLGGNEIAEIGISDSVPRPDPATGPWQALADRLRIVSCASLLADAIAGRHAGWSRRGVGKQAAGG